MTVIAQLSDIHITASADGQVEDGSGPVRALRAAVSSLLSLPARPDCVVLTGDLTERGLPAEYARLRALLSPLPMPVHPLPGNHDDRDNLRKAFADHPGVASTEDYVQYAVEADGVRVVCCDSTVPGEPGADITGDRLDWLDETLAAAPGTPTVVAFHHPPFPVGIRFIDDMGHADPDPLEAVIRRHGQVKRVISGHVHRASLATYAGTIATTCPSTYRQLYLDLTRPGRGAFSGEPAGFAVHLFSGEAAAVTHFVPVGSVRPLMEID